MSGALPSSPAISQVSVSSIAPTRVSVTHSLRRVARASGAQRWAFALQWPVMTRAEFSPIWAFALAQEGQAQTFTFTLPAHAIQGAGGGTPLVAGAAQSGTSLNTDGWPLSTLVLKAGDFWRPSASNKVYMMTADATSDGLGAATLAFFPALIETPGDNEPIVTAGPVFTVAAASDIVQIQTGPGAHYAYSWNLVEAP